MNRVFVDMDGVLVDFVRYMNDHDMTADEAKTHPNAYYDMLPIKRAIESVRELVAMGKDVWIATKAPTAVPGAYADKVRWILKYLPEMKRKIIITPDKSLIGDESDILIDDRIHKANCKEFKGTLIEFVDIDWDYVLNFIKNDEN